MKFRHGFFILLIIFIIITSVNFISAGEYNNESVIMSDEHICSDMVDSADNLNQENTLSDEYKGSDMVDSADNLNQDILLSSDDNYVAYVGKNTTEKGDGSPENPFADLKLACEDANRNHHTIVTVYINEGNYTLGDQLDFDTDNLIIQGKGKVIIKNAYNYAPPASGPPSKAIYPEAFGLTSTSAKFSVSNIIFDATGRTAGFYYMDYSSMMPDAVVKSYFLPFLGQTSLAVFENCSFIGFRNANYLMGNKMEVSPNNMVTIGYNSKFINCFFNVDHIFGFYVENTEHVFEYCEFNYNEDIQYIGADMYIPASVSISMENVWFGQNNLPRYISSSLITSSEHYIIPVTKYANFTVTQNYLGNDEYEIIGKLTWNGTDDQDGMENFQPMTVTLLSENGGEIASTATLVNGTFKTVYKNSASTHKITAILHNQDIDLEFSTVNITANPVSIYYGQDQNITVTFSQIINSTVSISINNRTYDVKVNDSDSFTYTIKDVLKEGTYTVNITLNDDKAGVYGENSTTFTVSKNDFTFDPNIPSNCKVGDDVKITVELPTDATGNIIVTVNGNTNFTETASANVEITINGLVAGDNKVTVTYSGDDKYVNKSVDGIITAEKVPINVTNNTIVIDSPSNSNTPSVSINLTSDATGNLTVTVKGKNYTQELVNGSATVTIIDLDSGTYDAVVTYSGDDKYDPITKNVTLTVNTIKTSIVAPSVTTTYNVAKKLIVTLKDANGNALSSKKVTVNVGSISKTLTTDANGQVSVDISSLVPKTYTASIKFAGDEKYAQSTATAKVVVNKVKSKITAKKATFKAKKKTKKYTITLKAGKKAISKVKVTLKVKGKTYKATTNAKGKATFKITKLSKKGKHNAVIKFKGNKYYKASSKKLKLTIKK